MSYLARSKRLVYIHNRLLYKRDYPSTVTLAKDYLEYAGDEFSAKTFQRDIEYLRNENAPIEYDPHHKGYYYTDDTYQLPAMQFNSDDLLTLLVIDRALHSYSNSPFYERLHGIFKNITKLLPEKVSVHSSELAQNFSIIPEPVTRIKPGIWEGIQTGLEKNVSVNILHRSLGEKVYKKRKIDPYHLIGYKGEWYLLGYSHHHEEVRIFALSRMGDIRVLKDKFEYPEDFNPQKYIDTGFGVFMKEKTVEVVIRFYPPTASYMRERYWHPDQKIRCYKDGTLDVKFHTNQQSQVIHWVSQWGGGAEILEPRELRQKAKRWLLESIDRYYPGYRNKNFKLENL